MLSAFVVYQSARCEATYKRAFHSPMGLNRVAALQWVHFVHLFYFFGVFVLVLAVFLLDVSLVIIDVYGAFIVGVIAGFGFLSIVLSADLSCGHRY